MAKICAYFYRSYLLYNGLRIHPCHSPSQALEEVCTRFHFQWRRKQQAILQETPDALDCVEVWCELWMAGNVFRIAFSSASRFLGWRKKPSKSFTNVNFAKPARGNIFFLHALKLRLTTCSYRSPFIFALRLRPLMSTISANKKHSR